MQNLASIFCHLLTPRMKGLNIFPYFSFLSKRKLSALALRTDEKFQWIIENKDTTLAKNSYTHDR